MQLRAHVPEIIKQSIGIIYTNHEEGAAFKVSQAVNENTLFIFLFHSLS